MNLYDMVRRKDRALAIDGGVESCELARPAGRARAVRFAPGAALRARKAASQPAATA